MALKEKPEAEEKTVIKASGLPSGGKHSRLQFIDVKDGRIIRARPFRYDLGVPPEAFTRPYDKASGLRRERVLYNGGEE